jgi:hypothetical protein
LGIHAGPVWTEISGDDASGFERRMGGAAGAFLTLGLTRALEVQPELLLVQKGGAAESIEGTGDVRLTYLQLPVLLRLSPADPASAVRPFVLAGGSPGFRVGCEVKADLGTGGDTADCDNPLFGGELDTRLVDLGLVVGGGTEVGRGRLGVVIDARYDFSLTTFDDSPTDQDVRNRAFMILLGVVVRPR